jgi:predicted nucleotidyltransferase
VALASMRTVLWERLRSALAEWDPPAVHASVFGSAARGDGTVASDIDLFIVRPQEIAADDAAWRDQVEATAERLQTWSGNRVSVVEQGEQELQAALASVMPPPIIDELRRDAIDIAGTPMRKLLPG